MSVYVQFTLDHPMLIDEIMRSLPRGTDILVSKVSIFDWPDQNAARLEAKAHDGRYAAVLFPAQSLWVWHEVELP